jgi:hypothetical protein
VEKERYYWDLPQMAKYGENSILVTELHDFQKKYFRNLYILI